MASIDKQSEHAKQIQLTLRDEVATSRLAKALATVLQAPTVIHLSGDLGSGKTFFCRALIQSLGYNGRVKSPTFSLVEPYNLSQYMLYHFDFYRFSSEDELRDAGFEEFLDGDAVALVEWPERAQFTLPDPDLLLRFDLAELEHQQETDVDQRQLRLCAYTARGRQCLSAMVDADSCAQE